MFIFLNLITVFLYPTIPISSIIAHHIRSMPSDCTAALTFRDLQRTSVPMLLDRVLVYPLDSLIYSIEVPSLGQLHDSHPLPGLSSIHSDYARTPFPNFSSLLRSYTRLLSSPRRLFSLPSIASHLSNIRYIAWSFHVHY